MLAGKLIRPIVTTALWLLPPFGFGAINAGSDPENLLLKDYRPRSIFAIPETRVEKARYPAIDVHSHH